VPGHLFYREAPLLLPLLRKAREVGLMDGDPLVLVHGNGRLHPRRMGIACQIGTIGLVPTCGVAKRLLLGRVGEWTGGAVQEAPVVDEGEVLGTAVRRGGWKPFYVSEGRGPDLRECVRRVRGCMISSKPEPMVQSHRASNVARRGGQNP
jgi:deoxyribonuclease V